MKVKDFIKKLQKCDPNAEVISFDSENDFYSAVSIYKDHEIRDYSGWVSLDKKPRPEKTVLLS